MYSGYSGLRPGNFSSKALILGVLSVASGFLFSGCATMEATPETRQNMVLPYRFQITGFTDDRTFAYASQHKQFPQEAFLQKLQNKLRPGLFSNTPATLRITLTDYFTTHNERDFTLSLALDVVAQTNLGKDVLNDSITCAQDHYGSPKDLPAIAYSTVQNPFALTTAGWEAKILDELLSRCVEQLAQKLGQAVFSLDTNRAVH